MRVIIASCVAVIILLFAIVSYLPGNTQAMAQQLPYARHGHEEIILLCEPVAVTEHIIHSPQEPQEIKLIKYEETHEKLEVDLPLRYVELLNGAIAEARCNFKSWMDYRSITYRNSRQWRMQQVAYTCGNGFRRVSGLYMIALGTYFLYGGVGDVFDITLSSGITFRAVVGDVKDNRHTDATNRYHLVDGSVVEFIIDRHTVCRYAALTRGDMSFAGFPGYVIAINRLPDLFIEI